MRQPVLKTCLSNVQSYASGGSKHQKLTQSIMEMIVTDNLPFSHVEGKFKAGHTPEPTKRFLCRNEYKYIHCFLWSTHTKPDKQKNIMYVGSEYSRKSSFAYGAHRPNQTNKTAYSKAQQTFSFCRILLAATMFGCDKNIIFSFFLQYQKYVFLMDQQKTFRWLRCVPGSK